MSKRLIKKNTDIYKTIANKDLLVQYLKTSIKKYITISYIILYIYKKNSIIKLYWKILAIIKNSLIIDNSLSINF